MVGKSMGIVQVLPLTVLVASWDVDAYSLLLQIEWLWLSTKNVWLWVSLQKRELLKLALLIALQFCPSITADVRASLEPLGGSASVMQRL